MLVIGDLYSVVSRRTVDEVAAKADAVEYRVVV